MLSETPFNPDHCHENLRANIAADLSTHGWSQQDFFLSQELTIALAAECRLLHEGGGMRLAGVGRGSAQALRPTIRGDQIAWLKNGQSVACDSYLHIMENLREALNRTLFLGLEEYESHFAFYSPGASYHRHKDRFQDDDRRTVSVVIYLNPDWLQEQGGALRLHPEGLDTQDIAPIAGRLVLFLSAQIVHEVLPATRDRMSIAGWFKRRI